MNGASKVLSCVMRARRNLTMPGVLAFCGCWLAACMPTQNSSAQAERKIPQTKPAAQIPIHVLTQDQTGSMTVIEQGDHIEVRLAEPTPSEGEWRLQKITGNARVEAQGKVKLTKEANVMQRVFVYRAVGIGTAQLTYDFQPSAMASRPVKAVTFSLTVK